jgi:hypothetical protein
MLGNPNVLIAVPDIFSFKITKETDFIIMGSKNLFKIWLGDGIFDRLSNYEIVKGIWTSLRGDIHKEEEKIHKISGNICDMVMKMSLAKHTMDNISCIFISFRKRFSKIIVKTCDNILDNCLEENLDPIIDSCFMDKHEEDFANHCDKINEIHESNNDDNILEFDGDSQKVNKKKEYIGQNKFNISYRVLSSGAIKTEDDSPNSNLISKTDEKISIKPSKFKSLLNFKINPKMSHYNYSNTNSISSVSIKINENLNGNITKN